MTHDLIDALTMTPAEAAERRAQAIEELRGWFAEQFALEPKYRSAMLLVSQHYSDNASDAVHGNILWSVLETPDLDGHHRADRWFEQVWMSPVENEEFDRWIRGRDPNDPDRTWFDFDLVSQPPWDDNGEAVALFAAFCPEGAVEEDEYALCTSPYAIFRRGSDSTVTVEVIGRMLRPWVDGLPGSWMHRDLSADALWHRIKERTPRLLPPAQGRAQVIHATREQVVRGFRRDPSLRSALLLLHEVGNDYPFTVMGSLLWSVLETPDLPGFLAADEALWADESREDPNRPGQDPDLERVLGLHLNPRVEGVAYFRAFCAAPGPTERGPNYAPYAIFRRGLAGPGDVEVAVVGTMLRPDLDGAVPVVRR